MDLDGIVVHEARVAERGRQARRQKVADVEEAARIGGEVLVDVRRRRDAVRAEFRPRASGGRLPV